MRRWLKWPVTWIVLAIAGIVWLLVEGDRDVDRRCDALMALTSTRRDSLDARMACERMHSDHNTATAISVAGGMAAGAVAGSARR